MALAFDQLQGLRQRDRSKEAEPLPGMPLVGQIEAILADVFQSREGSLELRLDRTRIVGAKADDEALLVAEPLAVNGDGVVELFGRADLGRMTSAICF